MTTEAQFAEMQAKLFKDAGVRVIEDLVAFFRAKAELAAYACSQLGAPEDYRRDMLATVRICHSFADKAEEALDAQKAVAAARSAGGFQ